MRLNAVALLLTGLFFTANTALASDTQPSENIESVENVTEAAVTDEAVEKTPTRWGSKQIRDSHQLLTPKGTFSDTPIFRSNPLNLFVIIEAGTKNMNIVDGDSFEIIAKQPLPQGMSYDYFDFSPNGRYVYFATRDGWVSKYDIYNLTMVAEIRVGLNTRNISVSSDGRWVLAGNYQPGNLVVLNANDLSYADSVPTIGQEGTHSTVGGVYNSKTRNSFVVALKDTPEIWELAYGASSRVNTRPKRIMANDILDEFSLTPDSRYLLAASRKANGAQVVDLHVGKPLTSIEMPSLPLLNQGTYWQDGEDLMFASYSANYSAVTVLNTSDWNITEIVDTQGPGIYVDTHQNIKHAWADVFFSPYNDSLSLINKETLEVEHILKPMEGKKTANVSFSHDGKYALAMVSEPEGGIVVYDTETLEEVKIIPMNHPNASFNIGNTIGAKINYENGEE